jgi:hypothetical protein
MVVTEKEMLTLSIIFIDKKIEHGKLPTLKEFEIGRTDVFRTMNNRQWTTTPSPPCQGGVKGEVVHRSSFIVYRLTFIF